MTKPAARPDQFDIGAVLQAPLADPEWLTKCLVMGLLSFVPFVGMLNLTGWGKTITQRRLAGDTRLPAATLNYIGTGWRAFVSFLPLVALVSLVTGGGGAVVGGAIGAGSGEANGAAAGFFIGGLMGLYLGILSVAMLSSIIKPAIDFLHVVDGERFAGIAFRRQFEVMRDGGMHYFLLVISVLLAGMIAQLGIFALLIGVVVTMPFAQAMTGAAIAEFERVLRPKTASFEIEGSLGASSGSPFRVSV